MTHLLFDLYGTLVDGQRMRPRYAVQLGQVMTERFGKQPQAWTAAYDRITEDWDSYYADLDLNGENALSDLREGEVRITRALFRLTTTPEPAHETLITLAHELPYWITRRCDAFYEDSKSVLEPLHKAGYLLGIASNTTTAHSRGILEGSGVNGLFAGAILGPDVTEHFTKDREFFLAADIHSQQCIVIASQTDSIRGANAAGIRTIQIVRDFSTPSPLADDRVHGNLRSLLGILGIKTQL